MLDALLAGLLQGAPSAAWSAAAHVLDPNECARVLVFRKRPARRVSRGRPVPRTARRDVRLRVVAHEP